MKGIEIGHIFYFGDKYSKSMKALVNNKEGKNINPQMGSYGIGVSRLPAAIIEAKYNGNYMKWPKTVTPFKVAIINLGKNGDEADQKSNEIYQNLTNANLDPILDDTSENPSSKFKNFDLIGIPYQIIIGSKLKKDEFEFKEIGEEKLILHLLVHITNPFHADQKFSAFLYHNHHIYHSLSKYLQIELLALIIL